MIQLVKLTLAAASFFFIANLALAQGVTNNYAEARFLDSEIGNLDGDGIEIAGSYQIDPEWTVFGSYSTQNFGSSVDLDILELGVGYLLPPVSGLDLLVAGSILSSEFGNDDDNGFKLTGLTRTMLADNLEGRASLNYVNIDDSDIYLELGADYFFNAEFSAGAEIQLGSDTDTISIGARWYYDNR